MDVITRSKLTSLIMMSVLWGACSLAYFKKPSAKELVNRSFSPEEIKEVSDAMNKWIETDLHYNLGSTRHISSKNWIILDPIFIRSDFNRAVGLVLQWDESDDSKLNSLTWICGYSYENQWCFFRPSSTQNIYKKISKQKYDPYKDPNNLSTIHQYTQGYLKYDKSQRAWVINDRWFRGFMDNASWLDQVDYGLTDQEILDLPDEYWVDKYMDYQKLDNRYLEPIKDKWREEDIKRGQGAYSDEEWAEIERLRNPQSSKDYNDLKESRKELFQDPIMMALEDKILKRIGQGKYFGK